MATKNDGVPVSKVLVYLFRDCEGIFLIQLGAWSNHQCLILLELASRRRKKGFTVDYTDAAKFLHLTIAEVLWELLLHLALKFGPSEMKQEEKSPLKERHFYYKSKKSCCCSACSFLIVLFLFLVILALFRIPIFAIFTSHNLIMINFTMGSCEFGSNCVSTCLYDLNKHGYSRMNFKNGLRPSSSWINVTGNVTGDQNFSGINVFSHSGRSVLHISVRIRNHTIVLNHRYDNKSFDKNPQNIKNRWFKVGVPFKLNLIPQTVNLQDQSTVRFYVNYVLPNGTLDKIGQRTIRLSPHDSIDDYAAMESYGQIFIASYCYGTCALIK
uniref:Galectin n=1 Tax=Romanomermis culicivorax TaxID=13658 RepID=A0A915ILB2_ROMCU